MELNVGMYVRYKYEGIIFIGKIKFISEVMCGLDETLQMYIDNCMEEILKKDIIKSSYNPIDLIEAGDVLEINNEKYEVIYDESYEKLGILIPDRKQLAIRHSALEYVFEKYNVSIVTKEQFEQIQYRIGD